MVEPAPESDGQPQGSLHRTPAAGPFGGRGRVVRRRRAVGRRPIPAHPDELRARLERERQRRRVGEYAPTPPRVGELQKQLLKQVGLTSNARSRRLHEAWTAALDGDEAALRSTRVFGVRANVLIIEVGSASLRHELATWRKPLLLVSLNARLAGKARLLDIDFKLGTFPPDPPPAMGVP